MELVSIREYARRIGVSHVAVLKLTKAGTIPLHNGKINPVEADRCRAQRCDPDKLRGRMSAPPAAPVAQTVAEPPSEVPAETPPQKKSKNRKTRHRPVAKQVAPPQADSDDPDDTVTPNPGTLNSHRLRGEELKNRQREISIAEAEGRLVDKEKTKRAVFGLARQIREHWQTWPARVAPIMASELGIDAKKLQAELDRRIREHLAELAEPQLRL
jgi:hypothetical protein